MHPYIGKTFRIIAPGMSGPEGTWRSSVCVESAVCVAFDPATGLGVYRGPDGRHYHYGGAYTVGPLDESGKVTS